MSKLHLKIVTPEKEIYDGEVEEVTLQTSQGQIGILPFHANLMAQIIPGELQIKDNGKIIPFCTGSGLVQMTNNNLLIATDLAERVEDIDEKAIEEAKKRAEEAMQHKTSDEEYATSLASLEKALAQLKVRRKHHSKSSH